MCYWRFIVKKYKCKNVFCGVFDVLCIWWMNRVCGCENVIWICIVLIEMCKSNCGKFYVGYFVDEERWGVLYWVDVYIVLNCRLKSISVLR